MVQKGPAKKLEGKENERSDAKQDEEEDEDETQNERKQRFLQTKY